MRRLKHGFFLLVILSACTSSVSSPASEFTFDPNEAITHSYDLLLQKGFENGSSYDAASFIQVQFPDGNPGAFVALGFTDTPRGYQFLYRADNNQLELISMTQTPGVTWGLQTLRDYESNPTKVDIEVIQLFVEREGRSRETIKVTGARHLYTGQWDDDYFEIIEISDSGANVIFSGVEATTDSTKYDTRYQYEYLDSDRDGNVEFILATSKHCEYQIDNNTGKKQDFGCLDAQEIFRFNGVRYVPSESFSCPVTPYSKERPPDNGTASFTETWYGNDALWAGLDRAYSGHWYAGPKGLKVLWYRSVNGTLMIEGKRLDTFAPPMQADIPEGYGSSGYQASDLVFPTEGCWEVVGRIGAQELRFIVKVYPAEEHPIK